MDYLIRIEIHVAPNINTRNTNNKYHLNKLAIKIILATKIGYILCFRQKGN